MPYSGGLGSKEWTWAPRPHGVPPTTRGAESNSVLHGPSASSSTARDLRYAQTAPRTRFGSTPQRGAKRASARLEKKPLLAPTSATTSFWSRGQCAATRSQRPASSVVQNPVASSQRRACCASSTVPSIAPVAGGGGLLGLVKIDAEGHDLAVVDGASRLLREGRIALLIWEGAQRWPDVVKRLDGAFYRGPEAYFAALARLGMDCYLLSRGRHLLLAGTTAARLGQVPCPYAGAVENWTNPAVAAALGRKPCRRAPQVGEGCTDPAKLRSRAVRRFRQARSYHLRRQPIENYACVRRSHALGRAFLEHSLAYQIFSDDRNSAAGGPVDAATLMTSRLRPL